MDASEFDAACLATVSHTLSCLWAENEHVVAAIPRMSQTKNTLFSTRERSETIIHLWHGITSREILGRVYHSRLSSTFPHDCTRISSRFQTHAHLFPSEDQFWQQGVPTASKDVRLMVKRVFITNDLGEPLPKWASWVKVVIDGL